MATDNPIQGPLEVKLNTLDKNQARFKTDESIDETVVVGYAKVEKQVRTHLATVTLMRSVWEEMGSPQVLHISTSR